MSATCAPGGAASTVVDGGYRPRLGPGVETLRSDDLGLLLREPSGGRFVRVSAQVGEFLPLLDGRHTLDDVRAHLEGVLGRPVPSASLAGLIEGLGRRGLLADPARAFGAPSLRERLKGGVGGLMNIRLRLGPAERLLRGLAAGLARVPFPLRRAATWLLLANGLLAPWLCVVPRWSELTPALRALGAGQLALLLALVAFEVVLHELAHGVALTVLGGRVQGFGIGIRYLVQPYTFTDTTDGYRLGRRERVVVSLAGPALDLSLLGLNALVFAWLPAGSSLTPVLLLLIAGEVLILLFNTNPLLPVDGYYVLADLLGEPSLRASSLDYWMSLPARLWGAATARRGYTRAQHAVYVVYGLLAAAYLGLFLASVSIGMWVGLERSGTLAALGR